MGLPNLNHLQWSETSARQLEWTFTNIATFGYYRSQIMVMVEWECSEPAENHQTLITNCLQETLVLTKNSKNYENIKIFEKTSLLTLTNDLFFFDTLNAFLASSCIFVQIRKYLRWRDVKIFLQKGCNQEVTGWLTFDLLPQRAIRGFFFAVHVTKTK